MRVELWDRSVQLVLDPSSMLEPHERATDLVAKLGTRLKGATLAAEGDLLRLILHREPRFRGGGAEPVRVTGASHELAIRIREAHKLLDDYAMSPLNFGRHAHASAPVAQRERWRMHLGLLAPALQKQMLTGQLANVLSPHSMPLAWADQELCCAPAAGFGVRSAK